MSSPVYPVVFTPEALEQLEELYAYIAQAPDGHSKCSTYGQSNCSTPVTVN